MSVGYVKRKFSWKSEIFIFSNDSGIGNFFTVWKWNRSIRFNRILKKLFNEK